MDEITQYIPGQVYRRELPCLLNPIKTIVIPIYLIIIDGYVWLDEDKKGLVAHLYLALQKKTPVIGVAKTSYRRADSAIKITRGESQNPLFINSCGID